MRRGTSGISLLLGVDKPAGMSSHDVVDRMRRILGERRVGHAGTLDPAATGVLVVGVGQGTRLMGYLTADTKSYVARIVFGVQTNTDDAEGEPVASAPLHEGLYDEDYAAAALSRLLGRQMQVPPAYSAISVDGKRAYRRARDGEEVVLPPRSIEVLAADLIAVDAQPGEACTWTCAFMVSKGTYVRALARDLGVACGCVAHLGMLCRTSSGRVTLAHCRSLEEWGALGPAGAPSAALDPVWALGIESMDVAGQSLAAVSNGRALSCALPEGARRCMVHGGRLYGIWEVQGSKLVPVINFPGGVDGVRP